MTTEKQLKEKYCIMNGWEKVKGYKINVDMVSSDYSYIYFGEEEKGEYIEDVVFWRDKEGSNEIVHEEIDNLISELEDYDNDISFEDWKKRKQEVKE